MGNANNIGKGFSSLEFDEVVEFNKDINKESKKTDEKDGKEEKEGKE